MGPKSEKRAAMSGRRPGYAGRRHGVRRLLPLRTVPELEPHIDVRLNPGGADVATVVPMIAPDRIDHRAVAEAAPADGTVLGVGVEGHSGQELRDELVERLGPAP